MGNPITFAIVGGSSFRAQYFLRIAAALPERFRVSGMVVRDENKGKELQYRWNIPTYRTLDDLLNDVSCDFVVISVSGSVMPDYILQCAERGIPALAETPPAPNLERLLQVYEYVTQVKAKVQVAEQYHLHPMHSARLSIIESGRLGTITETTVSISHMYHAVSLIRKMLGVGFEDVTIRAMRFMSKVIAGPGRGGPPAEEKLIDVERDLAWLQFGDKLGIYDFTKDQHRSWIRSNHLSVRGTHGEIFDRRLDVLHSFSTPLHLELKRINKGEEENQEGHYLEGIMVGESWVYRNPFIPARLYDDEIAIAHCLQKMADYVGGGPSFYSLAEASQDQYIGLLLEEALQTGEKVVSERQPWADDLG